MTTEDDARAKLEETLRMIRESFKDYGSQLEDLADACPYEMKLAVTKWVMKHIVEHAAEGGSFRTLIYERLGFGPDAYAPLCGDGMTISNEFDLTLRPEIMKHLKAQDFDGLKNIVGCCDEPGCFEESSAGVPTDEGYRRVCSKHYHEIVKVKKDV